MTLRRAAESEAACWQWNWIICSHKREISMLRMHGSLAQLVNLRPGVCVCVWERETARTLPLSEIYSYQLSDIKANKKDTTRGTIEKIRRYLSYWLNPNIYLFSYGLSDIMECRVFIEVFSKEIYAFRYDRMLSNFSADGRKNWKCLQSFCQVFVRD